MDTIKQYHSQQSKIDSLIKKNGELAKKNSELSAKCEKFRATAAIANKNRDNLKAKHKRSTIMLAELHLDKCLNISTKELADKFFMAESNIKNSISLVKRSRR